MQVQLIPIISRFCIYKFAYFLKFVCNPHINIRDTFSVMYRVVKDLSHQCACPQLRSNKATLCLLVSAPTVNKCPV